MKKSRFYLRAFSLLLIICVFTLNNSIFALSNEISPVKDDKKYDISESGLDTSELKPENLPVQLSEYLGIGTKNIELTDTNAEDLYSITLQNEDDSKTLYAFQQPIKFIDRKTNEIKFINNTLKTSKKSNGLFSNYAFENTAGDVKVYLPKKLNSGVLMETADYSLTTVPITEKAAAAEPKEQVFSGETMQVVQYTDAFSDGAHLQYAAINSGLKENIFLEKYSGQNVFSYIITAPGLIPDSKQDEKVPTINFLDIKTQEPIFTFSQPWARDSFDYEYESDYVHMTQDCFYTVKHLENDNWLVSIEIDGAFLENPETVYPVLIDPTQTISGGSAFSYATVCQNGDRYINDFHTIGYLDASGNIRGESVSYIKTNRMQNYTYINPDRISSAYYNVYECSGTGTGISVWLYDSNVSLNPQTCSFVAAANSRSGWSSTTTVSSAGNYSLNMTTPVKSWLKGALGESGGKSQDYGFTLTAVNAGSKYKQFYSPQKSGNGAYISINYTEDTDKVVSGGVYYLRNVHSGKYLDVTRSSSPGNNNDNVVQYYYYGNTSQQWTISYLGDGFYRLSPQFNTGKCLNVHNSPIPNTDDHANVNIWDYVSASSQKWRILQNSDGTYRLASQSGNKFLEVDGWSTADLGNVTQCYWANGNNQKWYLERANNYGYKGFAVYRDLENPLLSVLTNDWHSGLMDEHYSTDYLPVIQVDTLSRPSIHWVSWDNFNTRPFHGVYRPKQVMSDYYRGKVIDMARELKTKNIGYTVFGQMRAVVWPDAYWIWPEDVDELRCDGLIEYCYEYYGFRIYGDDSRWDISRASTANVAHHYSTSAISPKIQAQSYMTLVTSEIPSR